MHTFFRERPRVLIEGHDVDLEVEPTRPDELLEPLERGVHRAAFDPGHERLGHAGAGRQLPLRKTRPATSLSNELSGIHGSNIPETHRSDAPTSIVLMMLKHRAERETK